MSTVHRAGASQQIAAQQADAAELDEGAQPVSFPRAAERPAAQDELGEGRFGLALSAFIWCMQLTANLAVACFPLVATAVLLRPTPSTAWLVVLASTCLGPALAAGLYAVRARYLDPGTAVSRVFWRGYSMSWRDGFRLSGAASLLVGAVAAVVADGAAVGLPTLYRGALVGFAVVVLVVTMHSITLVSFFRLPFRHAVQLGAYYLVADWRVSLGMVAVLGAAVGVATVLSDLALTLLSGLALWLWYRISIPVLQDAAERSEG